MERHVCQDKNIILRRTLRATSLRLHVNAKGQAILTAPFFCPRSVIERFLSQHQDWLLQQTERRRPKLIFHNGTHFSLLGRDLTVYHDPDRRQGAFIEGTNLVVSGDASFLNRRVCDFIKDRVAAYISENARSQAAKIGQKINRITLKDTTSRWGSCSAGRNLNFCWRLGLAPLFVLDYIIAHEVAHLQEMNHGPRFWHLVSTLCDRRSEAEIWLRRNGHTLR